MKLLFVTDTHIRGTSPRSRTDDFQETMQQKLNEVIEIAKREKVDFILHGGDVFDRPNLSPTVVRHFVSILKQSPVPIYAIAGNHDIYGHNPLTIERTMLGLLDAFDVLQLIVAGEKIRLEKEGVVVQLSGTPFHYNLDKQDPSIDYHVQNEIEANYCIHMVHGMLVDRALPEGVAHTLVDQVWSEEVDILLTGHYHSGFRVKERNGKYIINPGALARINNHVSEINRMPQVVLMQLTDRIEVELIPLSCGVKGDTVLDRSYMQEARYREEKLASFVQEIRASGDFHGIHVLDIIGEIAKMNGIDDDVKSEAQRRIGLEEEEEREIAE